MRLALVLLLASTTAAAEPVAEPHRNAVSLQLATLDTTGIAIQGEHDLRRHKLTLAVALGGRSAAQGDFDSVAFGAGVELRRWLRRPTTMKGWYVGTRTDLARTRVEDSVEDRMIGALTSWSLGLTAGYRFVIKNRVEITPSLGTSMIVEGGMNGMSPTTVRGSGNAGLTAGVLF